MHDHTDSFLLKYPCGVEANIISHDKMIASDLDATELEMYLVATLELGSHSVLEMWLRFDDTWDGRVWKMHSPCTQFVLQGLLETYRSSEQGHVASAMIGVVSTFYSSLLSVYKQKDPHSISLREIICRPR